MREWRSGNPDRPSSPEWDRLADTTKKVWGNALDVIEAKWGDVPLAVFNDPRMKARIVRWRDSRASTPRSADIGVTVLRALLRFGELRGRVHTNAASGIPSIYRGGDRAEIIWTEDEIAAFCAKAAELGLSHAADGLRLAATTGLRREDLVSLTWDHVSDFGIRKKAKKRSRGKRRFANVPNLPSLDELLGELRGSHRASGVQTVLVDAKGKSWTPDRLTKAVAKVRDAVGFVHVDQETGQRRTKHLHDARGTYATRLMTSSDLTDHDLATIMGWSPEEVSRIRHHYVDQGAIIMAIGERIGRRGVNR